MALNLARYQGLPLAAFLVSALVGACSSLPSTGGEPQIGMDRSEVENLLGAPGSMSLEHLPEGALFGPQEALYGPLAAGDPYEEWRYDLGDDDLYVWYAGPSSDPVDWLVVMTAQVPKDAVY